ncbi:MAG: ABC transporter substrate-binding protein [Desulfobacterales bacterium]|nr:ABC transporter substrate-binding protein [Desulfobacterales bacterium]
MKTTTVWVFIIIFTATAFLGASKAYGEKPIEVITRLVDHVIRILNDPQYKDPSQRIPQRDQIWQITRDMFDFVETAKRTLARNWLLFSPTERKEFSDSFAELLAHTYISKVQGEYHNEKVVYLNQEMIRTNQAVVKTKVIREKIETPVDYSLILKQGSWKVYDINIEGVSLVKNYRDQFNSILIKEKPSQLIDRVKRKAVQQKEGQDRQK